MSPADNLSMLSHVPTDLTEYEPVELNPIWVNCFGAECSTSNQSSEIEINGLG